MRKFFGLSCKSKNYLYLCTANHLKRVFAEAQMAESVDALVSNTSRFTPVPVRPRLWVRREKFERTSLFFVWLGYGVFDRRAEVVASVAPRQTCLWSVVVCYANIRVCCAIVPENKFSPHRPSTPTIYDCNNLSSVCSRLLPPFEIYDCKIDNLPRYCTSQATCSGRLFRLIKGLAQLVAPRQTCLRSVVVCWRKYSCLLCDCA